jgi:hypothetical protein
MICTKFDWNWPAGSGEDFFNINTCKYGFRYCGHSRPPGPWFEQTWTYILSESYHFNKSWSLLAPLSKDNLYIVWLKLACWFWRCLKNVSVFLLIRYHLPLERGVALHMKNSESPLPKDDLCQLWLKFAQQFWRSRKCKSLTDRRQTDRRTTDNWRSEKLTWALRWVKKFKK